MTSWGWFSVFIGGQMPLAKKNEDWRREYYPIPTEKLKKEIRERDHYTCKLCGKYGNQVDHIIPLVESHDSSPKNLRTLCQHCNTVTRRQRQDAAVQEESYFDYLEKWAAGQEPVKLKYRTNKRFGSQVIVTNI